MVELFWRWLLIGALAFGGGQAALSLVERTVVADTSWATPIDFSTALAFAFITPGPILILAPFIGFRVAGIGGALAAAAGVFLVPWFLAAGSARLLRGATQRPWVRAFGLGAAPAVVALLAVSALEIARASFTMWPSGVIAAAALVATTRRVHPFVVLAGGAVAGAVVGLSSWTKHNGSGILWSEGRGCESSCGLRSEWRWRRRRARSDECARGVAIARSCWRRRMARRRRRAQWGARCRACMRGWLAGDGRD